MHPDTPQAQSSPAASLPPVSAQPLPVPPAQPTTLTPPQSAPSAGALDPTKQAVANLRQLVEQYQTNPFVLSSAVQQLKSEYIAQQYGVAPNVVEQ